MIYVGADPNPNNEGWIIRFISKNRTEAHILLKDKQPTVYLEMNINHNSSEEEIVRTALDIIRDSEESKELELMYQAHQNENLIKLLSKHEKAH